MNEATSALWMIGSLGVQVKFGLMRPGLQLDVGSSLLTINRLRVVCFDI
jgi:hypothetical protein